VRDHRPPHHRPHLQLRRPHLPPSPTTWTRSLTAQSLLRRYWPRQYTLPIVVRIDRVSICSPILNFMCCPLHPRSAVLPSPSYDFFQKKNAARDPKITCCSRQTATLGHSGPASLSPFPSTYRVVLALVLLSSSLLEGALTFTTYVCAHGLLALCSYAPPLQLGCERPPPAVALTFHVPPHARMCTRSVVRGTSSCVVSPSS
jgi:hypothetical protein